METTRDNLRFFLKLSEGKYDDVSRLFNNAYKEDKLLAVRNLLYTRDATHGLGMKGHFHNCVKILVDNLKQEELYKFFSSLPEYGSWKDLIDLYGYYDVADSTIDGVIIKQFKEDLYNCNKGKYVSLLSHFFPIKLIIMYYDTNPVYKKMCDNVVKNFKLGDLSGCRKFITRLRSHLPPVVTTQYSCTRGVNEKMVTEEWNKLSMNTLPENSVCVMDTSTSTNDNSLILGLLPLFMSSQNTEDAFKEKFITFSEEPEFIVPKGNTLFDKYISTLDVKGWGSKLNLDKVIELIRKTGEENNIEQEKMPKTIYILSDKEYDKSVICNEKHDMNVIFWSIGSQRIGYYQKRDRKTKLLSGFSYNILSWLVDKKYASDIMLDILSTERYSKFVF